MGATAPSVGSDFQGPTCITNYYVSTNNGEIALNSQCKTNYALVHV